MKTPAELKLRDTFRKMDANKSQAIREAYYKYVEGLSALEELLEGECELAEEHAITCDAIDIVKASMLGTVL